MIASIYYELVSGEIHEHLDQEGESLEQYKELLEAPKLNRSSLHIVVQKPDNGKHS